jgi:hypothetical protein
MSIDKEKNIKIFEPKLPQVKAEVRGHLIALLPPDNCKRVVKIDSKIAKRLADLDLHCKNVKKCRSALSDILASENNESIVRNFCIDGIIARFFSCFNRSETTSALSKKIYEDHTDKHTLQANFDFWQSHRNNIVAHSQGILENAIVGAVLDDDGDAVDIVRYSFRTDLYSKENVIRSLLFLIQETDGILEKLASDCDNKLREDFSAMDKKDLEKMQDATMHIPHTPNAASTLRRY